MKFSSLVGLVTIGILSQSVASLATRGSVNSANEGNWSNHADYLPGESPSAVLERKDLSLSNSTSSVFKFKRATLEEIEPPGTDAVIEAYKRWVESSVSLSSELEIGNREQFVSICRDIEFFFREMGWTAILDDEANDLEDIEHGIVPLIWLEHRDPEPPMAVTYIQQFFHGGHDLRTYDNVRTYTYRISEKFASLWLTEKGHGWYYQRRRYSIGIAWANDIIPGATDVEQVLEELREVAGYLNHVAVERLQGQPAGSKRDWYILSWVRVDPPFREETHPFAGFPKKPPLLDETIGTGSLEGDEDD